MYLLYSTSYLLRDSCLLHRLILVCTFLLRQLICALDAIMGKLALQCTAPPSEGSAIEKEALEGSAEQLFEVPSPWSA